MRVLITGMNGFVGRVLADYARREQKARVFGFEGDVREARDVEKALRRVRPDRVFHLAAQSFVPRAMSYPEETFLTNTLGALHLFSGIHSLGLTRTRIHVAGSAYEYGRVAKKDLPIREEQPLRPADPYAVSKVAQDRLAEAYYRHFGVHAVRTRAFSHIGPGQKEQFAVSSFARQIAMIEAGLAKPVLRVGNLESVRDFTDVRDVVRAYWLALERGRAGEVYNVARGKGYKLGAILGILLGLSRADIRVETDRKRLRRDDIAFVVGDVRKFRRATGWKPEISIRRTLGDVLDHWRKEIASRKI